MSKKDISSLKVAFVTDSMIAFGGSDRLLVSLLQIFPNSTVFTSIYNAKRYTNFNAEVKTTKLNSFKILNRRLNFLYPFFFEQFSFKNYDLVISLSAGPAKNIITGIYQTHIGIILTPPRNIWDDELNVRGSFFKKAYSFVSKIISHYLRIVDLSSIKRVDNVISISNYIKRKVEKIYRIDSTVIQPGINYEFFIPANHKDLLKVRDKYFLEKKFLFTVSRLYDYKNIDWIIYACIKASTHLYIAGEGPDLKYLKKISNGSKFIHFLGFVPDNEIKAIHQLSEAFVFCALEDWGYVTLEALALGKFVIGLNDGGTKEIVTNQTGRLINSKEELYNLISEKVWKGYNPKNCIKRAKEFSFEEFRNKLIGYIETVYEKEKRD